MDNRRRKIINSSTASDNILKYINKQVFIKIFEPHDVNGKEQLEDFFEKTKENNNVTREFGCTWILLEKKGDIYKAITLGQSQDIRNELLGIYRDMKSISLSSDKPKRKYYRTLYEKDTNLCFYKVDIDLYMNIFWNNYKDDSQNNLFYEISKDYFAEAMLAYFTGAIDWNYSFGGMDKRFYYHLLDILEEKQKDFQEQ
jgi:hypothetical protein